MKYALIFLYLLFIKFCAQAEDGYETWLRYKLIVNTSVLNSYKNKIHNIVSPENNETINIAAQELQIGLSSMLGVPISKGNHVLNASILLGTINSKEIQSLSIDVSSIKEEGFLLKTLRKGNKIFTVIIGKKDVGVLYGVFHFLKLIQTQQSIDNLNSIENPKIQCRLLNHWDNLDGNVERGYAGQSLWRWHELPEVISPRYIDYARYNASIGINGTVLNNVNANAHILTPEYLEKVKVLADIFRPYGIKVFLTARFNAPMELDSLNTADPLDPSVVKWWNNKVKEIYSYIPDFGGFLVKANSEGQPGPREYNRSHAEGANMLAKSLRPYSGIVMWRAFVYSNEVPEDRAKQAYNEFIPLDGKFDENVLVQTKNGAIDFQPREPFHPMFGAMKKTPLMMEFQITQEYLGQGMHLCYLAPLFKECLQSDTYAKGIGSTVSMAVDGTLHANKLTGIAGVANIGSDRNWTGHPFGQANWYAFGRLAWDHELTSEKIADEWVRMTFGNDSISIKTMTEIMMMSREAIVNYSTPLGLHHQMAWDHHYGPGPWIKDKPRIDWTSVYYHKADAKGIGFDRTVNGSNAVTQYFPEVRNVFNNIKECPEKYLLWFHHVPWEHKMKSGRTLWDELCFHYNLGVNQVAEIQNKWNTLDKIIDEEKFKQVQSLLNIQLKSSRQWKGSCVLYFQTLSQKPLPEWFEKPEKSLQEYKQIEFKYLPGSKF